MVRQVKSQGGEMSAGACDGAVFDKNKNQMNRMRRGGLLASIVRISLSIASPHLHQGQRALNS